ncbi:two-component system sensor histidine kinase YesM [Neobacillus bataviensis]|uniref:Two-component system sensor histidine kinase YesM n=1 Tax=Neobacillus bataviensis TaxID=220685 RepID=A0A561CYX5_9BACI|nr:sensor histidine kinase [Neobacillus bataviensis]TWD96436.1 two-component system sensor histidine kinase YesM [Neobacillus bataviensis]
MKSIQSRLFLMLLIFIILPYFLTVFFIYGYTKKLVEQHELEVSHNQMEKASNELEQYFADLVGLPYVTYRNPDLFRIFEDGFQDSIYFNPIAVKNSIETFYLMRGEIRQIRFYIDKSKESFTVYNAMVSTRKSQPDLVKEDSIKKLYHSHSKYLIEPPHPIENYNDAAIVPESDNTIVLTIHHKVMDVLSNKFLGVITLDIDLNAYAHLCNSLVQNDEESVLLVDTENRVMYASNRDLIGKPVPSNLLKSINNSGVKKGKEIILSKTLSGPLRQWKLVKITPEQVLFHDVRQTAYTNILVGIGVGLLGLLMIGIISYMITRPIKLLSRKVQSIEAGNMDVPFHDNGQDEIGHLEKHIKEMMNRINLHIAREYKLEIENRNNQLRALKSQVNPHFLFNALQTIGAIALRSNSPKVYGLVTSLSKMMRYSIRANQWVLVREEVDYIKTYLSLQVERFGNELNYTIHLNETILERTIPSMTLQPLVENFFKHCYEEGFYDAQLSIYGEIQGEILYLVVENNRSSMTPEELQTLRNNIYTKPSEGSYSMEHIGLKNIHDRLVLNYGIKAGLEIDTNQGQGFIVRLMIPVESKFASNELEII